MSWEEYKKFKETGKAWKVPWVKDFWNSIDLTEEQYVKLRKVEVRLWIIIMPLLVLLGALLYQLFSILSSG